MVKPRVDDPLTAEELRERLHYDPKLGLFWWKERPGDNWWNSAFAGKPAGSVSGTGYIYINVHRLPYRAHRLAWMWMTRQWPPEEIDHIDGNPANNAWDNLRLATRNQNSQNRPVQSNNTTGVRGISYYPRRSQWLVRVMVDKKSHFGGWFNDLESAKRARTKLAERLHKQFHHH